MKNKEKYREQILEWAVAPGRDICDFKRKEVLAHFGKEGCDGISCPWCTIMLDLWLDEEYKEPEVDWGKVPVDTLVRVRNSEDDKWLLRYFHLYCEDEVALKYNRKYKTFHLGATRKTCMYPDESWRYCELVEDEDE